MPNSSPLSDAARSVISKIGERTPLTHVVQNSNNKTALVEELLEHRIQDVDKVDWQGRTALHYAILFGYDRVVRLLLKHGADITINAPNGKTASELVNPFYTHVAELMREAERKRIHALRFEAFIMGHHPRLGAGSHVRSLHADVLQKVLNKLHDHGVIQ
jgi:hypothetical protein